MNPQDFARLANNFYTLKGIPSELPRIELDAELTNYVVSNAKTLENKYKVAFVFICLNPLYWQYAPEMVQGAKQFFLPGHNTDFFFWTDIPENKYEINYRIAEAWQQRGQNLADQNVANTIHQIGEAVHALRSRTDVHIIPTEPVEWPYPTLLRYNLFLQEEQKLKDYDYIFYCDVDMRFVGIVGDEILSQGITAAQHPMYATPANLWPPYEPNPQSASYIPRPGKIINDNGKPRFMPLYWAGGFQGGKSDKFIEAMKRCKKRIDDDLAMSYVPIWNDETVWNRELFENPPDITLSPSFIYPDSLIKEYYETKVWGQSYQPKLVTLTKWFSTSKEGGEAVAKMINK